MNVLVLGGGYIGNHVFNHLKRYHDVEQITQRQVDYTCINVGKCWKPGYKPSDFKSYLNDKRFDIAVNCSGYTGKPNVDACEDDKEACWEYNVLAPVRTTEVLNLYRIPVIHVSSGCIYQGNQKWTEDDTPNFGLYDHDSSFYSKSKHAGELALRGMNGYIFRIRMPFCSTNQHKNILVKYLKYDNILSMGNSLTCVNDLCEAIEHFCVHRCTIPGGVYNVVNKGTVYANRILEMLEMKGLSNPKWEIVPLDKLNIKAGRSNCTLAGEKLWKHYDMPYAEESLEKCINQLAKCMQ
jgi:dTDP-4-dehydrorhamnose reductase